MAFNPAGHTIVGRFGGTTYYHRYATADNKSAMSGSNNYFPDGTFRLGDVVEVDAADGSYVGIIDGGVGATILPQILTY